MLPAFQSIPGAIGLQADATNCGIQLSQAPRGADERAAGAQTHHKMRDSTGRLFPYFVRRAAIVRLPVCGVAVLIGIKIFFWLGGGEFAYAPNRAVSAFIARSHHQFSTISMQHAF